MSKYTTSKRGRSHGGYDRRLEKRGLAHTPRMTSLRSLRKQRGETTNDLPRDTQ